MVHSEEEDQFFEFTWTISHFSLCRHKPDEFLDSPNFTVKFLENTEWHLRLYPKGQNESRLINNIMCFLRRTQVGLDSIDVQYSITMEDSNCEVRQTFRKRSESSKCVKVSCSRYLGRVDLSQTDLLKVICRLKPQRQVRNSFAQAPYPPVCCSASSLVPVERRNVTWSIGNFCGLPSQHEVSIPVVSASDSPKLLVTLSWSDETLKEGGGLQMEVREMPELVGKTFQLGLVIQLVDGKSKRHRMARGWYLFKTVQKNYWLWVKTYSDSVWNFPLAIDRGVLHQKREEHLQQGTLVLECDFSISYDPVVSHVVSSGYVHAKPEPIEVNSDESSPNNGWREMLLRNFNDQNGVFNFFFLLFVFLAIISRIFKDD